MKDRAELLSQLRAFLDSRLVRYAKRCRFKPELVGDSGRVRFTKALIACGYYSVERGVPIETEPMPEFGVGDSMEDSFGRVFGQDPETCLDEIKMNARAFDDALSEEFKTDKPEMLALLRYYGVVIRNFLRPDVIEACVQESSCQAHRAFRLKDSHVFNLYGGEPELLTVYEEGFGSNPEYISKEWEAKLRVIPSGSMLDIGGGVGALAAAILSVAPQISEGFVYDLPRHSKYFENARAEIRRLQGNRIRFVEGDFFAGGDEELVGIDSTQKFSLVSLAWVLNDWNDEKARIILNKARSHITQGGELWVFEKILPEETVGRVHISNFIIFIMAGGGERTLVQFTELIEAVGFRFEERVQGTISRDLLRFVRC